MISADVKCKCDIRREQIDKDESYQTWLADLKSTVNQFCRIQRDRMRTGNQIKVTKAGKKQKVPKGQRIYTVSTSQHDFNVETYNRSVTEEKRMNKRLEALVKQSPVYERFLVNVPSIGVISAAIILSQFAPEKVYYVSNMFSFAGIVTGKDKLRKGEKAHFNTFLRAKLIGVIGANFIKQRSDYALYYYTKRIQLLRRDMLLVEQGKMNPVVGEHVDGLLDRPTAAHHCRMAIRYMVQRFIRDYYVAYRTIMDIPVIPPYEEEKLDLVHVGTTYTSAETFLDSPRTKEQRDEVRTAAKSLSNTLKAVLIEAGYAEDDGLAACSEECASEEDHES